MRLTPSHKLSQTDVLQVLTKVVDAVLCVITEASGEESSWSILDGSIQESKEIGMSFRRLTLGRREFGKSFASGQVPKSSRVSSPGGGRKGKDGEESIGPSRPKESITL
mmetsp:Transcript_38056/g.77882  ORF Transcript_38056/g.77882 Transcript_38056/m.77882 type:complete len:109 (+) Transcript_38056:73-399(+)